ncbi:MAG: hypothetical protein OS112_10410 [Methanoregula sp.]|nr:MAG: hypothetical protein OS112_10410 [Methanoregula sp.]
MKDEERTERKQRHSRYGFIPAGVLIGLGVGLLTGFSGSGVLIGLGLGFLATALVPAMTKTPETADPGLKRMNITMLLVGIFLILIGVGVIWAPADLWPLLTAGFLIMLGIWFAVRGFHRDA